MLSSETSEYPDASLQSIVATTRQKLKICFWNAQCGVGTTKGYWQYPFTFWKIRYPHGSLHIQEFARDIDDRKIDILALAEVDGGSSRTRGDDYVKIIADNTELQNYEFYPTIPDRKRSRHGNAILSRYPISGSENHPLSGGGESRYIGEANIELPDERLIRFYVTHLGLKPEWREAQLRRVEEVISDTDLPGILAGDFNVSEPGELRRVFESRLRQAVSLPTFPSWKPSPRKPFDHMFFSEHFQIGGNYTDPRPHSDHLALIAEVNMNRGSIPL